MAWLRVKLYYFNLLVYLHLYFIHQYISISSFAHVTSLAQHVKGCVKTNEGPGFENKWSIPLCQLCGIHTWAHGVFSNAFFKSNSNQASKCNI